MKSKCSKSPAGKHKWAHKTETEKVLGTKTQVRRCENCGYKEKLVENFITGRKRWEPV